MSMSVEAKAAPHVEICDVPLEKGGPLLGVVPSLVRDPLHYLSGVARARPGEIVAVRVGPIRLHIVSDPEHVQFILADEWRRFSKGGMWEATRPLLGNGLVASEGDFWMKQRRMMQPLFAAKFLASLVPQMVRAIDRERDDLEGMAHAGAEIDVSQLMARI